MRNNWEVQLGQNSYIQNLFVNQGKTWKTRQLRPTLKNINFECMDEVGKAKF